MTQSASNPIAARHRILAGLLGAPIARSAALAMHGRAAEALDLRCHYQLIEIAGAGREQLKILPEGVRRLGFAGINVTFAYKQAVAGLLDELSADAASIGAVNTIVVRDDRLIGRNTDATGFARPVLRSSPLLHLAPLPSSAPAASARRSPLRWPGWVSRNCGFSIPTRPRRRIWRQGSKAA